MATRRGSRMRTPALQMLMTTRRATLGAIMRARREELELTQAMLAERIGLDNPAFIASVETGRSRIPPERLVDFAEGYQVDPRRLGILSLWGSEPMLHRVIFETESQEPFEGWSDSRLL